MSALLQLSPDRPTSAATPSRTPQIRVVLADDHTAVRRGLRLLLDAQDDVHVVAEARDLSTVVRHIDQHAPHVLVLDLQLRNGASTAAIRRLHARAPDTEIVVLTTDTDPTFAEQALGAGAQALVLKQRADADLATAVRAVARGETYVSPPVAAQLAALEQTADEDELSEREVEVLRLVALGYTSAEIAGRLQLSRRTVEGHRARLHRKLGLSTRAELVAHALRHHLIDT